MLSFLPAPPDDFRSLCREAQNLKDLKKFAHYRLTTGQLEQLAKALSRRGFQDEESNRFRLGLLSNSTTDFLVAPLCASALRYELDLELVSGQLSVIKTFETQYGFE